MSDSDTETCILCNQLLSYDETTTIKEKGIQTLIHYSIIREDGLDKKLANCSTIVVHNRCRRNYNRNHTRFQPVVFRERETGFPFDKLCCICAEDIGTKGETSVAYKLGKKRIIELLREFSTPAGQVIIDRIEHVELEKYNARYHKKCMLNLHNPRGCPEFYALHTAMQKIYDYIDTNDDSHFFLKELTRILPDYIPDEKTIKKHLKEKYGQRILITETPNGQAVLSMTPSDNLSNEDLVLNINCQGDNLSIVRKAAEIIREDLSQDSYSIPESLQCFVRALPTKKQQAMNKNSTAIARSVMSLTKADNFVDV